VSESLRSADAVLQRVVSRPPRVPGVVAIATDRRGNVYEGAAGKRVLGQDAEMTSDTVFAIFSTTKAITGTACLQLVEARSRRPGEGLRAGHRQAAGSGRLRCRWTAEAPAT
jgi:CubicO group peptidase (beta-lactamase class C family)